MQTVYLLYAEFHIYFYLFICVLSILRTALKPVYKPVAGWFSSSFSVQQSQTISVHSFRFPADTCGVSSARLLAQQYILFVSADAAVAMVVEKALKVLNKC